MICSNVAESRSWRGTQKPETVTQKSNCLLMLRSVQENQILINLFQQISGQQDNGILVDAFEILKVIYKEIWMPVRWTPVMNYCCHLTVSAAMLLWFMYRLPFVSYWHHTTWNSNFRNCGWFKFQSGKTRFSDCFFLKAFIDPGLGAPISFWT